MHLLNYCFLSFYLDAAFNIARFALLCPSLLSAVHAIRHRHSFLMHDSVIWTNNRRFLMQYTFTVPKSESVVGSMLSSRGRGRSVTAPARDATARSPAVADWTAEGSPPNSFISHLLTQLNPFTTIFYMSSLPATLHPPL